MTELVLMVLAASAAAFGLAVLSAVTMQVLLFGIALTPATAGQHEHDRGEHRAVIHRGCSATLRTWIKPWDQRLRQRPQLVRHQPPP